MIKLKHVNNTLVASIVAVNMYTLAAPFSQAAQFWLQKRVTHQFSQTSSRIENKIHQTGSAPTDNRLLIPALLIDEPIYDGADARTLDAGIWHRPQSSTPGQGSNTVLAGHRFSYHGGGIFYHLNQLKVGDEIGVFWQQHKYIYKVVETKTVPPSETSVEAPTSTSTLTLYTCTPLWSPKNRLVIIAQEQSHD